MERIGIISQNAKAISAYLNQEMNNVDCFEFVNVFDFNNRVEAAPLRIDTLLIQDGGLSPSSSTKKIREAAEVLKRIIVNHELFEVDRVIFLNKTENTNHLETMKWFEESKAVRNKTNIFLYTYDQYTLEMVKGLLTQNTVNYDNEIKYNLVIRKERDRELNSKYLDRFITDKTVIVEHSMANLGINESKAQLESIIGDRKLPLKANPEGEELIEEISVPEELPKQQKIKTTKLIGVFGESKSGTSVTSMILAATASDYGKTLVIDMNYNNLGLSYLAEKTLFNEEVNIISLGKDIIEDSEGIKVMREKTYDKRKLHALVNSLPVTNKYDIETFAFMITNIINAVKSNYEYIVLDIPADELVYYATLINKLDKVVLCAPPYMNNIISLFSLLAESNLMQANVFNRIESGMKLKDIVLLRTLVFSKVNKNIKPVKADIVDKYSMSILNRTMPITGIYEYNAKNYKDTMLFKQIVSRGEGEK